MTEKPKLRLVGSSGADPGAGRAFQAPHPLVFVIDDDSNVREALSDLLTAAGLRSCAFGSAEALLSAMTHASPACVVVDLELPGISGLDLQRELAEADGPPIVFISGHGDIPSSVRAMKAGAIEFLPKPFSDKELLTAIESAIAQHREIRRRKAELAELRKSYALLSPREREVLPLIVAGLTNKHTAAKLGIAEITVQIHRAQIVRKLAAQSLPDLVRMASKLGIF